MDDTSISPLPGEGGESGEEIPAMLESLAVDGTRPAVGDQVELKVSGTVKKIVNDTAYITPESVNDTKMDDIPTEESDEQPDLRSMAEAADREDPGY